MISKSPDLLFNLMNAFSSDAVILIALIARAALEPGEVTYPITKLSQVLKMEVDPNFAMTAALAKVFILPKVPISL